MQQDRAGLEGADRPAIRTVRVVAIDDRRHPVVRADRQKFRLELVAFADIDRDRAVFETALFEHDADLPAVRSRPVIEVDHDASPDEPAANGSEPWRSCTPTLCAS